jgi:hypothetical protein
MLRDTHAAQAQGPRRKSLGDTRSRMQIQPPTEAAARACLTGHDRMRAAPPAATI